MIFDCLFTGFKDQIDGALDLIRSKFPLALFPRVTLAQTNVIHIEVRYFDHFLLFPTTQVAIIHFVTFRFLILVAIANGKGERCRRQLHR